MAAKDRGTAITGKMGEPQAETDCGANRDWDKENLRNSFE